MMKIKDKGILELLKEALREDGAWKDLTSETLIPSGARGRAELIAHDDGVLCGMGVAAACFQIYDDRTRLKALKRDGARVAKGDRLATATGFLRSLLSCERVVLNFMNHLSGIATLTSAFAEKANPYGTRIYDTRKTTPLWRVLEKYAVRTGGGWNHRSDLSEAYFIKDNHIEASGGIQKALEIVFSGKRIRKPVIVEARSLEEAQIADKYPVDLILLDNMKPSLISKALKYLGKEREIEISGGINLSNVGRYARTGVSRISVGALTHSVKTLDISMEYIHVRK